MDSFRTDNPAIGKAGIAYCTDPVLLQAIRTAFEGQGIHVLVPDSAADVPARAKSRQPVLMLLDAMTLDAPTGVDTRVLEALKASPYTATLPVTALLPFGSDEATQLAYFRRGANDCIVLPESQELLTERLRAATRSCHPAEPPASVLSAGGVSLDLRSRKVTVEERNIPLTRKEFDLLNMLMLKRGVVVYTTHLYHSVWGYGDSSPVDAHTVKVHISSLRGKLGADVGRKIVNLPGLGYRFDG